jgi:twitching motility protein PilT
MDMLSLLTIAQKRGASDIIITVGRPPMFRVTGQLVPEGSDIVVPELSKRLVYSILNDEQRATFEEESELDLSISLKNVGRFRVNVFKQRGCVGAALRTIVSKIPTLQELDLPKSIINFCNLHSGLICVTGPTGSGKSTTLSAMINYINQNRKAHIITIEDPIEFVHPHINSVIEQREIGKDTNSYTKALKSILRQDPDVVLVGEMRDLETIAAALTIAETGHIVFSTLHTQSAAQTIDRIVDVFPPYQQQQIRTQLASTLKGVVSQLLLPRADGMGRVAAREIMVVNSAISNLIREGKTFQIPSAIQTGQNLGMVSMDKSLQNLKVTGKISNEVYLSKLSNPQKAGM